MTVSVEPVVGGCMPKEGIVKWISKEIQPLSAYIVWLMMVTLSRWSAYVFQKNNNDMDLK